MASGGSAANTIHGIEKLSTETGFIGSIGKDETGVFFENDMQNAGVNTMLIRRDSVTGTAVALVSPDFERTFATHLGAAVELSPDDLYKDQFIPYDILYLEGYLINDRTLVEKACRLARENGMEIALDLASYNVVEARLDDFSEIVTRYTDILFANEDEARAYTGLQAEQALKKLSKEVGIAVVKTGSKGSMIMRGDEFIKVEPLAANCRDTTGAGDLYASGFLYGYGRDLPLGKCGALGSLLAGSVIELTGARIPDGRWPAIKEQVFRIVNE
jgi:sugar/nucleoside kinase (ribokinase family)